MKLLMLFCLSLFSWYAVHCTSMNNTNQLISGDNKGYASYLFEKSMNKGSLPGKVRIFSVLLGCRFLS